MTGALPDGSCSPVRPKCCWCRPFPILLAGRMEILRLHPLSQGEIHGGAPNFLDDLFSGTFRHQGPNGWGTIWRRGLRMAAIRPHWLAHPPAVPTGTGTSSTPNSSETCAT